MINFRTGIFGIGLLLLVGGCASKEGDDLVISPDKEVKLLVRKQLEPAPQRIELLLETVTLYPCEGTSIQYDGQLNSAPPVVNLLGIRQSMNCNEALAPAEAEINLGELPNGEHKVELFLNEVSVDTLNFLVTEQAITILNDSLNAFLVPHQVTLSLPENAYVIMANVNTLDGGIGLDALFASLPEMEPVSLEPNRFYGYFSTTSMTARLKGDQHWVIQRDEYQGVVIRADKMDLMDWAASFRESMNNPEKLLIFSTQGEQL